MSADPARHLGHSLRMTLPESPPSDAPSDLASVWPLVLRWAVSDDVERGDLLERATVEELTSLVEDGRPLLGSINDYLDATGNAESAVPYGDLAQAVMEAEFEIQRRT
jgi:hypothetical protein